MPITLLGPAIIQQLDSINKQKDFLAVNHPTDEGYESTQYGGEKNDIVTISFKIWGDDKILTMRFFEMIARWQRPVWFINEMAVFTKVRITRTNFDRQRGDVDQIRATMSIQRMRVTNWDKILSLAFSVATLTGKIVSSVRTTGSPFTAFTLSTSGAVSSFVRDLTTVVRIPFGG